jgi:ribosomal protein S18 acetylase RimI-like enzyme
MSFQVEHRLPTVDEYNKLRLLVDWPIIEESLTKRGIANSLFSVCIVTADGLLIGMGRVVGDGAIYFHLQDVIVHPDYQRKGIGKIIATELLNYVDTVSGKNTNIGLMSSKGREKFYVAFGFVERPTEKFGAGMIKIKN